MIVDKELKIKKKKKIIIDALKRRLETDVYSNITVQDIADEAGFSKGGVLHYFHTKEDIYLELIEDIFSEFTNAYNSIFQWKLKSEEIAPISAMVGVEQFILDKRNIKILINLFLYAFEDEKIMGIMRQYINRHHKLYHGIISDFREDVPSRRKTDLDTKFIARVAQAVIFFIGLLESMDPTDINYVDVVKYLTGILKG
ncbi:MAG: TetR/AcrR family transcriptional regulator [bacterium]|nr:TetR/AcrR family transcriptional regulator [bacterium]